MRTNTHVLNQRFGTLALMLLCIAFTAEVTWAQQARERQASLTQHLLGKAPVNGGWTIVSSKKKGTDFGQFIIADGGGDGGGGDDNGTIDRGYEKFYGEEDKEFAPTTNNAGADSTSSSVSGGGGGSGEGEGEGEGGTTESGYERVLEDRPVSSLNALAEPSSEAAVVGNYPNPFNPETTIRFEIRAAQTVRLAVYNTLGQQVKLLVDGWVDAGAHEARFDGYGLPSGTYFTRLITEAGVVTRTMVLAK